MEPMKVLYNANRILTKAEVNLIEANNITLAALDDMSSCTVANLQEKHKLFTEAVKTRLKARKVVDKARNALRSICKI